MNSSFDPRVNTAPSSTASLPIIQGLAFSVISAPSPTAFHPPHSFYLGRTRPRPRPRPRPLPALSVAALPSSAPQRYLV